MGANGHVIVEKRLGETPLDALERYRAGRPELCGVPMTYAGRLDPMAEGALLILIGEECKKKERYLACEKEYECEVLFDVGSDTGDVLGLLQRAPGATAPGARELERAIAALAREHELPYPAFSSKTVGGVPLFLRALRGGIAEGEVPRRKMRVREAELLSRRELTHEALITEVERKLFQLRPEIPGRPETSFRRDEVRASWRALLSRTEPYTIARWRARVSSGTYIRSLSPLLAHSLGTRGLAFSITRTRLFLDIE